MKMLDLEPLRKIAESTSDERLSVSHVRLLTGMTRRIHDALPAVPVYKPCASWWLRVLSDEVARLAREESMYAAARRHGLSGRYWVLLRNCGTGGATLSTGRQARLPPEEWDRRIAEYQRLRTNRAIPPPARRCECGTEIRNESRRCQACAGRSARKHSPEDIRAIYTSATPYAEAKVRGLLTTSVHQILRRTIWRDVTEGLVPGVVMAPPVPRHRRRKRPARAPVIRLASLGEVACGL